MKKDDKGKSKSIEIFDSNLKIKYKKIQCLMFNQ